MRTDRRTFLLLALIPLSEATIAVFVQLTGAAIPIATLDFYALGFAALFLGVALAGIAIARPLQGGAVAGNLVARPDLRDHSRLLSCSDRSNDLFRLKVGHRVVHAGSQLRDFGVR